jgi:hypothetical protein
VGELKTTLLVAAVCLSSACAVLHLRMYLQRRVRLSMWSAVFFAGLTVHNVVQLTTLFILSNVDLRFVRLMLVLVGAACVYGVVRDAKGRRLSIDEGRKGSGLQSASRQRQTV